MKAFFIHLYIELKTSVRKKQQMFLVYFFPIGFYLMMGAVMPQLNPMFLDDMIPSMIVFAAMTSTFLSIPEQIIGSRQSGVFRGLRINGLGKPSIISIPLLTALLHMTIVSAFILVTAPLLFNASVPANIPRMLPISWLTVFSFSGISLLIGTIAASSRSAMMLSQAIFIPSMLIGGLMIPLRVMPENIRAAAILLPSSHSMSLFKSVSYGREILTAPSTAIMALAFTGIAGFIISGRLFKWNPS